jgi:hypothetical protein
LSDTRNDRLSAGWPAPITYAIPYGDAQDSIITAKVDSTKGDTLPYLGDTTHRA